MKIIFSIEIIILKYLFVYLDNMKNQAEYGTVSNYFTYNTKGESP